jgi:hypothetical protein
VVTGARVRLGATLAAVTDVPGGVEALIDAVIETDAAEICLETRRTMTESRN